MSVAVAAARRDYLVWTSYRLAVVWQVLATLGTIAMIYFAGTVVGDRSELIGQEGGSYVAFILVGLAFMDLLFQGMGALPRAIQDQQRAGTLEPMLLAPVTSLSLLTSFWLFRFLVAVFRMSVMIGFGVLVLGFWREANPLTVLVVTTLAQLTFLGIGAYSAAFVILVKEGDPVRLAYAAATTLLGGVFFPPEALPAWLEPLTFAIPLTHALSGIRAGLAGGGLGEVAPQAITLALMALVLLPTGVYAFKQAIVRAKREGALGEY